LRDRLPADISHDERLVIDLRQWLLLDHLEQRCSRPLSNLRINRTKNGMLVHHNLVGSERNQRTS